MGRLHWKVEETREEERKRGLPYCIHIYVYVYVYVYVWYRHCRVVAFFNMVSSSSSSLPPPPSSPHRALPHPSFDQSPSSLITKEGSTPATPQEAAVTQQGGRGRWRSCCGAWVRASMKRRRGGELDGFPR